MDGTTSLPKTWRLLGFLPLTFFLARLIYFSLHGGTSQILWMCHLSNLTLAIGLLFDLPILISISAYWFILGFPFWVVDVIGFGLEGLTSAGTHLGGTIISVLALRKVRSTRRVWHYALSWYLFLQWISRLFTPPELNINIAHAVYRGWEGAYPNYASYWLLTTLLSAASLWLLESALMRIKRRRA